MLSRPLITAKALRDALPSVKVLDASWYLPSKKRNCLEEFMAERIPTAQYFDIDRIADTSSSMKHMLPTEALFEEEVTKMGINNDSHVVVYDSSPAFLSSARVWWTFRVFGHEKISVLEGGLDAWKASNFELESGEPAKVESAFPPFKASFQRSLVVDKEEMKRNMETKERNTFDARPFGRFIGKDPEPRGDLPKGHIPGSFSSPFSEVLDNRGKEGTCILDQKSLKKYFKEKGLPLDKPIITTCGSGVSAAVVALALHTIGHTNVPVYDGSWAEWASDSSLPIKTGDQ